MCVACLPPVAIRRPVPAEPPTVEPPTAESSREEVLAFLYERNAARARPRPICPKCRYPFAAGDADVDGDGGMLRRELCSTCESRWLDKILRGLRRRYGRKRAIKILKGLMK